MSMRFDEAVGHQLRHLRRSRGWTQTELGEKLGLSFQQVQKYESGVNRLSLQRACKMAAIFSVSLETLLPSDQELPNMPPPPDRQQLRLMRAYSAISCSKQRGLLCSMADTLATHPPQME